MASELAILRVLDALTLPQPQGLRGRAEERAESLRSVVASKNVVGLGIAEKDSTGELALTFYVEKKVRPQDIALADAVPPAVPPDLAGERAIPTNVVELGRVVPEAAPNVMRKSIKPGYSIGHPRVTAGTLGAIVERGGRRFLLSNSHVLANSGKAKKGDPILFPGKADGGRRPEDVVGHLVNFVKFTTGGDFVNAVDCAISDILEERQAQIDEKIFRLGHKPAGVIKPRRGMKVVKVGRTTGRTYGEIRDVNFRLALKYNVGSVGFLDQILCTRYTDSGDSGSLVLDRETKKAVGLHFAGASGGSVFNPIGAVLKALGVKLVT